MSTSNNLKQIRGPNNIRRNNIIPGGTQHHIHPTYPSSVLHLRHISGCELLGSKEALPVSFSFVCSFFLSNKVL